MEATLTGHDFQLAEVRFLVPLIHGDDLSSVARFAAQRVVFAPTTDHPPDQLQDWELREYILSCAQTLYTHNPEHLEGLLDEIGQLGRKRAATVVGKRRTQGRKAGGAGV